VTLIELQIGFNWVFKWLIDAKLENGKRSTKNRADWEKSIKPWTVVPSKKKTIIRL